MKILFFCGTDSRTSGGVFTTSTSITKHLLMNGIDIEVICFKDEFSEIDRVNFGNVKVNYYNNVGGNKFGFSFDVFKIINKIKPDIIHTQSIWMYMSIVSIYYKLYKNVPIIISPHGMLDKFQLETSYVKKKVALILFEYLNLSSANCIHALCESEYKSIRNLGLTNPVAIIPNGVSSLVKENELKINVTNKKKLLFIGRIDPKKNLHTLIKAWLNLEDLINDWELLIVGDAVNIDYLESLKRMSHNINSIKFLGGLYGEDKENIFLESDAFILPSFSEGLPMSVLEAWRYKKVSLISEECNLSIGFEKDAAIKIGTDVDGITTGLKKLFNLPKNTKQAMEKTAYELVEKEFTWEKIAKDMENLYKWVYNKEQMNIPSFIY